MQPLVAMVAVAPGDTRCRPGPPSPVSRGLGTPTPPWVPDVKKDVSISASVG